MVNLIYKAIKNWFNLVSYPSFVTYIATWRCNAKCLMCDIWKKDAGQELNLRQIEGIFKQLKSLDAVRITGGEPFVRADLAEVVNSIQRINRPKVIHITTNGLLKEKILDSFSKINNIQNIHIKISINAFGKEHDRIMGLDGAFQTALATLEELVRIRDKQHFFIGVNQTITSQESREGYDRLKEICDDYKVDLLPVFAYAKTALYSKNTGLNLMPKKKGELNIFADFSRFELEVALKKFLNDVSRIKSFTEKMVKKYYLKGAYNRLIRDKANPSPKCVALNNHLRILPNGDVPVCLYNSNVIGNLLEQSFRDLWLSENTNRFRDIVKNCPICWAGCEVIPNAVYTGDIVRSISC